MNQPHIIKEGESNDSSSIYKCNLSTDVWKPLNHQIHINNLTENNYEIHQLQSNPNIKTPHSPKLDLANSAAAQESDDKDDVKRKKIDTDSPNVIKSKKRKMSSRSSSSSSSSSSSKSRSQSPIISKQIHKLSTDMANQNSLKKSSIADLVRKRLN